MKRAACGLGCACFQSEESLGYAIEYLVLQSLRRNHWDGNCKVLPELTCHWFLNQNRLSGTDYKLRDVLCPGLGMFYVPVLGVPWRVICQKCSQCCEDQHAKVQITCLLAWKTKPSLFVLLTPSHRCKSSDTPHDLLFVCVTVQPSFSLVYCEDVSQSK